jgi:formamidopyrimidine-DNA glycosylase
LAGQPEIRIMTDFFNRKVEGAILRDVKLSPSKAKFNLDPIREKRWEVKSVSRGKEAKVIFKNAEEEKHLLVYFFKGGVWEWYKNEEDSANNPNFSRDHKISFHFEDGSLISLQDQFHQAHLKWGNWGKYRSPDIVLENNAYRKFMYENRKRAHFEKPIYRAIMHQWFFNGINNFSRTEILYRTRFSPFTPVREILESEILREELFETMREVLEDIYSLGGTQLGRWKNPFGQEDHLFKQWIQGFHKFSTFKIYEEGKIFYCNKRWKTEWELFKMNRISEEMKNEDSVDGVNDKSDI